MTLYFLPGLLHLADGLLHLSLAMQRSVHEWRQVCKR